MSGHSGNRHYLVHLTTTVPPFFSPSVAWGCGAGYNPGCSGVALRARPGVFEFPAPTPRRWFDPPYVDGFDYSWTREIS